MTDQKRITLELTREHSDLLRDEAGNKVIVLRGDREETINPDMKVWLEARIGMWDAIAAQLRAGAGRGRGGVG